MNNFFLFVCGTSISLISGMGVLVYMASLGYKQNTPKSDKESTKVLDESIDNIDNNKPIIISEKITESFVSVPSPS